MKQRKKLLLIIVIGLLIISCNKKKSIVITSLEYTKILTEERTYVIPEGCYDNVFIIDSMMVLTSLCDDKKIHVYNKETFELIEKFGTKGSAPFELSKPWTFTNTSITSKNDSLNFYDVSLWKYINVKLNKIISGEKISDCISSNSLDKNLFFSSNLTVLNNDQIAGMSIDESKGLFFIYDAYTENKKWIEYHPEMKMDEKHRKSLYSGVITANPSRNTIIHASRYFDQVSFYDITGNLTKEYYFSDLKIPLLSSDFNGVSNEMTTYAVNIYPTLEHCYIFRIDQSMNDILNKPKQQAHILVFNWDGLLIDAYEFLILPELFCVDEESGHLYLIKSNQDENNLSVNVIKYKINFNGS
jgi:hypothetical protein